MTANQIFRQLNAVKVWADAGWHSIGLERFKTGRSFRIIWDFPKKLSLLLGPLPHEFSDQKFTTNKNKGPARLQHRASADKEQQNLLCKVITLGDSATGRCHSMVPITAPPCGAASICPRAGADRHSAVGWGIAATSVKAMHPHRNNCHRLSKPAKKSPDCKLTVLCTREQLQLKSGKSATYFWHAAELRNKISACRSGLYAMPVQ